MRGHRPRYSTPNSTNARTLGRILPPPANTSDTGSAAGSKSASSRTSDPAANSSTTWYDSGRANPNPERAASSIASISFTSSRGVSRTTRSRPPSPNRHSSNPPGENATIVA